MKELAAGAPLLDIRLGYTPAAAYYLFDTLGDAGRAAYLRMLWEVDLVLPALFGVALFLAVRREAFRQWRSIPLLATGCDYAENIAITVLLLRYPVQQPAVAQLASVFTVMKLVLYASGLVLYIAGFIVQRKKSSSKHSNLGVPRATAAAAKGTPDV